MRSGYVRNGKAKQYTLRWLKEFMFQRTVTMAHVETNGLLGRYRLYVDVGMLRLEPVMEMRIKFQTASDEAGQPYIEAIDARNLNGELFAALYIADGKWWRSHYVDEMPDIQQSFNKSWADLEAEIGPVESKSKRLLLPTNSKHPEVYSA